MSNETIAAEIAQLQSLLNSGATSVSSDGESVTLDTNAIRRRLAVLQSQLSGQAHRARRVRTLDLRRAFE